jgi:HAMP domain-containing protein
MGWLSRWLRTNLISRLEELRSVAQSIGRGDLRRRASEQQADELGHVAQALNRLLDASEEQDGRSRAAELRLRELLLGRLEAEGRPAALISIGGDVVASTFDDAETSALVAQARRLRDALPDDLATLGTVERDVKGGERPLLFRLLVVDGRRAVGWSVTPR